MYPFSHGKSKCESWGVKCMSTVFIPTNIVKPLKKHPLNKGHFSINDT